jgi:hypothetical protein
VASSQIGLEVDGDHVTLVEVSDGLAVSARSVAHPSMDSAISLALAGYKHHRSDPAVRVVLASPGINLRRIDVTASMLQRRVFEDAAFTAMPVPRETNTTAGIFFDPAALLNDLITPGVAVIAPTNQVDRVYEALGRRDSELVAPPCVFSGLDGVWVGLRHRTADVTLVVAGRPVAYRQLRSGGLDTVNSSLGDNGSLRLQSTLNRSGMADQIAGAELNRYLLNVAAELRQTVDYWQRSGESVPGVIYAYGAGATAPGLVTALADQRLEVGMHPEVERRLVYLPAAERAGAVSAFLAAVSAGADMPQVAFVNPYAIAHEQENRRRDRRARKYLSAFVAAGFIGIVSGIPYIAARLDLRDAKASFAVAQTEFDATATAFTKLTDTENRVSLTETFRTSQPSWSAALSVTYSTMPVGSRIRDLNASLVDGEIQVRTSADLPGGSYADLTRWLEKLRGTANVSAAWAGSFSNRDGRAVFDLTFTIPAKDVISSVANGTDTGNGQGAQPEATDSMTPAMSTTQLADVQGETR